jgi:hypothetical protein
MKTKIMFLLMVITAASLRAEMLERKLTCLDTGGGYRRHAFQIDLIENQILSLTLEADSEVIPKYGMKILGEVATKAKIYFDKKSCQFRPGKLEDMTPFACGNGISKVTAQLTLLDGSERTVNLPDNTWFELSRHQTDSVFSSKTSQWIQLQLSYELLMGFQLARCR